MPAHPLLPSLLRRRNLAALSAVTLVASFAFAEAEPPPPTEKSGRDFVAGAAREHGDQGRRAAEFLWKFMPAADRENLSAEFLLTNLRLAFSARERFPWAKALPEDRFRNDVLPYAVLDEPREPWREKMLAIAAKIVAGSSTASEAAQALNRDLFNAIGVHYHTGRKRPNQSPAESIAQGRATCTGLSILLVDACRAVGIPARVAGVAEWTTKPGNHTWVEIWDGRWKFLGADEYDAQGLDRGWFVNDAAKAIAGNPRHAVWASSWAPADGHFPLAWAPDNQSLGAENVTARYAQPEQKPPDGHATVHLRVIDSALAGPDRRILVTAELRDGAGEILGSQPTQAGTADLNDMATFTIAPGQYAWRLGREGEIREAPLDLDTAAERIVEIDWQKLPASAGKSGGLNKAEAEAQLQDAWTRLRREQRSERERELAEKSIAIAGKTLRWNERVDGPRPKDGYALWISLHGGGGTTKDVNDGQFKHHLDLYPPTDGIWVAPRAPTDAWDMWHQSHIDPMLSRLIEDYVITGRVNPDRVYLLGYSAGGDGVYQVAPRMADRFAAAAMMAGHPNEASPLGLRNLPFAIFMGGDDAAYRRNEVAAEWGKKLDALRRDDPTGYPHWTQIYPGLGHWMNRRDAEAVPWLAKFERDPWPKKIVWYQDDVTHDRFYWLAIPAESARAGQTITAEVSGQTISVAAPDATQLELRLSDSLIDLDRPITVLINGVPRFSGLVPRTARAISASLQDRADPASAATATLTLPVPATGP